MRSKLKAGGTSRRVESRMAIVFMGLGEDVISSILGWLRRLMRIDRSNL